MQTSKVIHIVGCHAEGEVGDVIVGGVLPPPGNSMFERMTAMQRDQDDLRRLLLCEPRGSVARHVNLITPPTRADCDFGLITMEPTEFVPMSTDARRRLTARSRLRRAAPRPTHPQDRDRPRGATRRARAGT